MIYSRFFLKSFLLSLVAAGCSTTQSSSLSIASGLAQDQQLIESYGELRSPQTERYLLTLKERLLQACPTGTSLHTITVLRSAPPMAFSPGPGIIAISRTLIMRLKNEAELAFILAHELSHQILGHKIGATFDPKLELEADSSATKILIRAGYDPRAGAEALLNSYDLSEMASNRSTATHPQPTARVSEVWNVIHESGWRPPGSIDRRDFHLFKGNLTS